MTHIVLTAAILAALALSNPRRSLRSNFCSCTRPQGAAGALKALYFNTYRGTRTREKAARVFP